jgi:hypothetical protein
MTICRKGQIVIQTDAGRATPLSKAIQKQGKRRESHLFFNPGISVRAAPWLKNGHSNGTFDEKLSATN